MIMGKIYCCQLLKEDKTAVGSTLLSMLISQKLLNTHKHATVLIGQMDYQEGSNQCVNHLQIFTDNGFVNYSYYITNDAFSMVNSLAHVANSPCAVNCVLHCEMIGCAMHPLLHHFFKLKLHDVSFIPQNVALSLYVTIISLCITSCKFEHEALLCKFMPTTYVILNIHVPSDCSF